MDVLSIATIILGSSLLATLATLIFTSSLRKAQRKKLESEVTETTSQIYSNLVKDLNDQLEAYKKKYADLASEFDTEVARLKKQSAELRKLNSELRKELKFLKKSNHDL